MYHNVLYTIYSLYFLIFNYLNNFLLIFKNNCCTISVYKYNINARAIISCVTIDI